MKITKESVFETSKSLQAFANILSSVIFIGHYWQNRDLLSLSIGAAIWFTIYLISILMLNYSVKEIKNG